MKTSDLIVKIAKISGQRRQKHLFYLFKLLISKCSITTTVLSPGSSTTLMGLGTLAVYVFRMASKLAISPRNILLACQIL